MQSTQRIKKEIDMRDYGMDIAWNNIQGSLSILATSQKDAIESLKIFVQMLEEEAQNHEEQEANHE